MRFPYSGYAQGHFFQHRLVPTLFFQMIFKVLGYPQKEGFQAGC